MNDTTLMVFAKAPRAGKVKTRLTPLLGPAGAAAFHAQLVSHTLTTAQDCGLRPLELHCAPDASDPFFTSCAATAGAALVTQTGSNLGARMCNAFRRALARARRAILIGTDCPALSTSHLRRAQEALTAGNDAVLVPTEDGGYALIGLARCDERLFDDIEWGSADVMAQTRDRLSGMGWRWHELDTLWDVDRPDDYRRLLRSGLMVLPRNHA